MGTVGVTIIRENGEVIKMVRKTGNYSSLFLSKEFNEGNYDKAIDDYIKPFMEMKEDYKSGKPSKYPISPVYGYFNETSPVDYGLVVIDFKNKKIHSMQDYDIVGSILPQVLSPFLVLDKKESKSLKHLFDNNLINVYLRGKDQEYRNIATFEKLGTFKEIYKNIIFDEVKAKKTPNFFSFLANAISDIVSKKTLTNNEYMIFFPKELEKFEQFSYTGDEPCENTIKFFSNLVQDGFIFNQQEIKDWQAYLESNLDDFEIYDEDLEALPDDEYDTLVNYAKEKILERFQNIYNNSTTKKDEFKII